MKRFYFTVILMVITCNLSAQFFPENFPQSYLKGDGYFYIKGKIDNLNQPDSELGFSVTDYFDINTQSFVLNKDGTFEGKIPITNIQTVFIPFPLGNGTSITSFPGDTVYIHYDLNEPETSLKISGATKERTATLKLYLLLSSNEQKRKFSSLKEILSNPSLSEENKIEAANKLIDERIAMVDQNIELNPTLPNEFSEMIRYDICYDIANTVISYLPVRVFSKIHTPRKHLSLNKFNKNYFLISQDYRSCLHRYLLISWISSNIQIAYDIVEGEEEDDIELSRLREGFHFALSSLNSAFLRDWYITDIFVSHAAESSTEDLDFVYEEAKKIFKTPEFLEVLEKRYNEVITLSRGNPAPEFSLRNEKGETVRLSDFKGKTVILDIWNRYCAPCIGEFKNHDEAFHKKMKENDIVLIYICGEDDFEFWKKNIKKYNLKGVNLIADQKEEEKLKKDYSMYAYPHYVIIDKDGNIFQNQAESPSKQLLQESNSQLKDLLKTYKK